MLAEKKLSTHSHNEFTGPFASEMLSCGLDIEAEFFVGAMKSLAPIFKELDLNVGNITSGRVYPGRDRHHRIAGDFNFISNTTDAEFGIRVVSNETRPDDINRISLTSSVFWEARGDAGKVPYVRLAFKPLGQKPAPSGFAKPELINIFVVDNAVFWQEGETMNCLSDNNVGDRLKISEFKSKIKAWLHPHIEQTGKKDRLAEDGVSGVMPDGKVFVLPISKGSPVVLNAARSAPASVKQTTFL